MNKTISCLALSIGMAFATAEAVTTFTGSDTGASSALPRTNSDAAAAAFDLAAGALGTVNLIDFESAPVGTFASLGVGTGVTIDGIGALATPLEIRNTAYDVPDNVWGYNTTVGGTNFLHLYGGGYATFTFANPIQAFGAYVTGAQTVFGPATVTFDDGTAQSFDLLGPNDGGAQFFGFTDAGKSISSITFNALNDVIAVDDVRYVESSVGAVPEPFTMGLAALGLGVALKRRRR